MQSPIHANLSVNLKQSNVEAKIIFSNTSQYDVFLWDRNSLSNGWLGASLFEISCENKKVGYIGLTAKLGKPKPEDFIKIAPNSSITHSVFLNKYYELHKGSHIYKMKYYVYNPLVDNSQDFLIESNTVTIKIEQ